MAWSVVPFFAAFKKSCISSIWGLTFISRSHKKPSARTNRTEGVMTRYHLWFARPSRDGPRGAHGSGAVTGAPRPVPYCAAETRLFGRLLQGVFTRRSPPLFHQSRGSLCGKFPRYLSFSSQWYTLYHNFVSLSTGNQRNFMSRPTAGRRAWSYCSPENGR